MSVVEMSRARRAMVALAVALAPGCAAAHAQSAPPGGEQHRGENGNADGKPLDVTIAYSSDLDADIVGGESRGLVYLGRIGVLLDADLNRMIGLRGTVAHLSFHDIHGVGLSGRHVGDLLLVSGLEAEPALRLNQLWVEVSPAAALKLRIGKFTAAQEFMSSQTAGLFVNSTFGWPGSFATDLPGGGPSYPLATPGARLAARPDDRTTMRVAAFAGDPAGPGGGDPQRRERHGFNTFGLAGKPFVIAEISRATCGKTPALTATLGGWVHLDRFADLGDPASTPGPITGRGGHGGNWSGYGVVDARLWRSAAGTKRTANGFVRLSYSPSDRNAVDFYIDGGVSLAAPFTGRDGDAVGVAVGVARISPRLRTAARALIGGGTAATVPPAFEAVAELTYQAAVAGPLKLQPNVQYVIHPANSALSIRTPGGRIANALVLGLRTSVSF